jgi:hypothetical protein
MLNVYQVKLVFGNNNEHTIDKLAEDSTRAMFAAVKELKETIPAANEFKINVVDIRKVS